MLPLHLAPDMQTGVAMTGGPASGRLVLVLVNPSETVRAGVCSRAASRKSIGHCNLSPLIWGVLLVHIRQDFPSWTLSPSSPPWADLSTKTRDPFFLLPSPVGSDFFLVSSLLGIQFPVLLLQQPVSTSLVLTTFPLRLLNSKDFHATIAK